MQETKIEKRLRVKVMAIGGLALKWTSPGMDGVPDRICFFPGGRIVLVETKATKGVVDELQVFVHDMLRRLGADVRVLASYEQVDAFIAEMAA